MKRKSPTKHSVHTHVRNKKLIHSYDRGKKRKTIKLAKPIIYKLSEEKRLASLFDLQNKLIEHKYPVTGVWELILTHAGDIFRGISNGKSNSEYIMEKVGRLKRYIEEPLNRADFKDFKFYSSGEYYRKYKSEGGIIEKYSPEAIKLKKAKYLENLKVLRNKTQETKMSPKRKEAMLNALDITKRLFKYFETSQFDIPYEEFDKLEKSVKIYLGERK